MNNIWFDAKLNWIRLFFNWITHHFIEIDSVLAQSLDWYRFCKMSSQLFRVNIDAISTSDTHYMEMVLQDDWAIQYDTHSHAHKSNRMNGLNVWLYFSLAVLVHYNKFRDTRAYWEWLSLPSMCVCVERWVYGYVMYWQQHKQLRTRQVRLLTSMNHWMHSPYFIANEQNTRHKSRFHAAKKRKNHILFWLKDFSFNFVEIWIQNLYLYHPLSHPQKCANIFKTRIFQIAVLD